MMEWQIFWQIVKYAKVYIRSETTTLKEDYRKMKYIGSLLIILGIGMMQVPKKWYSLNQWRYHCAEYQRQHFFFLMGT